MNVFTYPLDLFAWALLLVTLIAVTAIVKEKRLSTASKYLALSLTFFIAGTLGLLALYSLAVCAVVCLLLATLCSVAYCNAWREDQRKQWPLTQHEPSMLQGRRVAAYLLADLDSRAASGRSIGR